MSQKGFVQILIVALIVLSLGGYFIYQKQTKPVSPVQKTIQPSSKADETANWKTYTSDKFSIKYPENWQIGEHSTDGVAFYPPEADLKPDSNDPLNMKWLKWPSFSASILARPFNEDVTANLSKGDIDFITDYKEVTVDNIRGHYYRTHQCAPKCSYTVALPYNGGLKTLFISMTSDGDVNLFNQIYPTFKFTK